MRRLSRERLIVVLGEVLSYAESRQGSREVAVAKLRNILPVEIAIMTRFGLTL